MAEDHARQRLDFHVLQRGALDLGEAAHLRLREADVVDGLLRQLLVAVGDFGLREPEGGGRPFVEFRRVLARRDIAALADVREDRFDGGADFRVVAGGIIG